jgi:hypothetical protein
MQACKLKSMEPRYCILMMLLVFTLVGRSKAQRHRTFCKTPDPLIAVLDSLYSGIKEVQRSGKRKRYTTDFTHDARNFSVSINSNGKVLTSLEEVTLPQKPREIVKTIQIGHFHSILLKVQSLTLHC